MQQARGALIDRSMAVNLRREGVEDFAVLERGDGVGGTWHYNMVDRFGVRPKIRLNTEVLGAA